jgi:hypothetical protein
MADVIQPNKAIINSLESKDYKAAGKLMLEDIMKIEHGTGSTQQKATAEEQYLGNLNQLMANDRKLSSMGFPSFNEVFDQKSAAAVLDTNRNGFLDAGDERISLAGTDLGDKLMHKKLQDRTQTPGKLTPQLDNTPTQQATAQDSTDIPGAHKGKVNQTDLQPQTTFTPDNSYPAPTMVDAHNRPMEGNAQADVRPVYPRTGTINLDNWNQKGDVLTGASDGQMLRYGDPKYGQTESGVQTQITLPADLPVNREVTAHLWNGHSKQKNDLVQGRVVLDNQGTKYFQGTTMRHMPDGSVVPVQITVPLHQSRI